MIGLYNLGLTDFDFVCVDGTIIKATNSPFNVIYYEDASFDKKLEI